MANNKMYLCYRPTGRIVCLGKRMGFGWYRAVEQKKLLEFFDQCEQDALLNHTNQDAFCLLMEDDEGLINSFQEWTYDSERTGSMFDFVKFKEFIPST